MDDVQLVGDSRARLTQRSAGRARTSGNVTAGSLLVVVAAWIAAARPDVAGPALVACIAAYAIAASVEFEVGPGVVLPTEPVLVISLFLLAPALVPVVGIAGMWVAAAYKRVRNPDERERFGVLTGSAWPVVAPAAVFAIAGVEGVQSVGPVLVVALLAQFVVDAAVAWIHNCWGLSVPPRALFQALGRTFVCDALLAPLGLAAVLAAPASPAAVLFVLPLVALFALLAAERTSYIDRSLSMAAVIADTTELARRDPLTGVRNRLAWEERTAAAQETHESFGFVLADVDGLKQANDMFGYEVGDRLLVQVAQLLARSLEAIDDGTLYRIGGDEFAIVLPSASPAATTVFAHRLQETFASTPGVSASIGWGFVTAETALATALHAAESRIKQRKTERHLARR
ncbi:MAG TPA: GGDEF domain-containing protein [Acidimicrobiia bacterium]|nr:GGDEF domain-containing protein [Acidimicrobiia bacterium]